MSVVPFERVVELYGPSVLRFCAARAGRDRAEDVFQETMLAALRAYDRVRDPDSIRAWLFSIAAHKTIDAARLAARTPEPAGEPDPGAASDSGAGVRDGAVWAHVRRLPEKQREALALRYLGDLSYREIAEVMGTSEAAARRNVFEALRRLRAELDAGPDGRNET